LNPRSFDGRGNYTLGVKEQIIFPEIDYDSIDQVRGLDITITTSAKTDAEAFALLTAFGMPFSTKWRPKGFDEAIGVESEPTDEDGARVSTPSAAEQPAETPADDEPSEDEQATDLPAAQADGDVAVDSEVKSEPDAFAEQTDAPEAEESADTAEKESTD
jgi:hypothetical protein